MTDHPKKPNKIVIPDGLAPQWAYARARELWKDCRNRTQSDLISHLIAMLEEEPIDEDLIEARKICEAGKYRNVDVTVDFLSGTHDETFAVQAVLSALKRGRELGKAGGQDHD